MEPQGYGSQLYAKSFSEFGIVDATPLAGLQLIRRPLPGGHFDLTGVYPFSSCRDWSMLPRDLDFMRATGAVSIVFASDPLADLEVGELLSSWPIHRASKSHFVIDMTQDWRGQSSKNTRWSARRGRELHTFEIVDASAQHSGCFWSLYRQSIAHHQMCGVQRLSAPIIAAQLEVPGALIAFARHRNELCGALISYQQGDNAYLHLMGLSAQAHSLHTSNGLIDATLEELEARGSRFASLGGGRGSGNDPEDGLFRFKRRWTTVRRTCWLCGVVLDRDAYRSLVTTTGLSQQPFFPSYRYPGSPLEWLPHRSEGEAKDRRSETQPTQNEISASDGSGKARGPRC